MPDKPSTLADLRRRAEAARQFPSNTCAASRHVHLVADAIGHGQLLDPADTQHIAESLYAVLAALYRALTQLHATYTITLADLVNIADAASELDAMQSFFVDQPDKQANIKRRVEQLHNIVERASGQNSSQIYAPADGS